MLGNITRPASAYSRSPRTWRIAGASLALAAAFLIGTSGSTLAWAPGSFSSADEHLLLSLTNQDRASSGLKALTNDSYLHKEAEWRAKDMGDRDYFSHKIPPGNSMVFADMQKDGYCFKYAGENIGLSTFDDATATSSIETAFMNSKDHRANILGGWSRIGVGAYQAADGRKLYAVLFSVPCSAAAKAKAKATPKPTAKPTAVPTAAPTLVPVVTPTPVVTPNPDATPTESVALVPTAPPSAVANGNPEAATADVTSLRVHQETTAQGPVDSFFHSFFGGLLGW
jgi:uncharacterized protein YkwD